MSLIIDTELIRYKWASVNGDYPDWQKLIPSEFNYLAHFDTVEAIKATNSLKALSGNTKDYPIDLTIGDGKLVMANPDDKGQTELIADTDGEVIKVRINGGYLVSVLKACGGMVEFKLTDSYSPMLFTSNGYQVVVMPMLTNESNEQAKKAREAKSEQDEPEASQPQAEQAEPYEVKDESGKVPQPVTPTEPVAEKPKGKRSRAKQPVTA